MTPFMRMRDSARKYIQAHEMWVSRAGHGLIMLLCLIAAASAFPFAPGLNRAWIILPLSVLGAFMPFSAEALVIWLFILLNLFTLSGSLAGLTLVMLFVAYIFCAVYQARKYHHIAGMVAARLFGCPYVIPVQAALLGSASEVVTVIGGAVLSFFLREVSVNANILREGDGRMALVDFLRDKIVGNQMLYVYILAMVALFLIVYVVRRMSLENSWIIAVGAGVSVEFLVMLTGYLFIGSGRNIPMLILANLLTVVVGLTTSYLFQDLDYSRVEKVQFEDDDYYYYVTAVPKIRLAEEKKEIKRITPVVRSLKPEEGQAQG